jgi:hypothetical protein
MTTLITIPTLETGRLVLRVSYVEHYIANAPGGEFHSDDGPLVNIWRHHKGALT